MSTVDIPTPPTRDIPTPSTALDGLRALASGQVLTPSDPGYDDHRAGFNVLNDHRPSVVVVAADVGDVVTAVRYATDQGMGLGIQATGHGSVLPVDGVLLDTSRLTDVIVDPARATAWVSAGCRWGEVLAAAQRHGLAPLLGSSPLVGAIGYTLGGGLGWLARPYGLACDTVSCFEVVTPDGRLVRATADEHRDLFRALRGGGGGALGVVTGMEIGLVPVTTVYAGNLLYPPEMAAEVIDRYTAWVADAPEALTSGVVLMNYPPFPELPEPIRGKSFTIVRGCWAGDLDEGRALLDAWRAEMPPLVDQWGEMPFTECAAISQDPTEPIPAVTTGGWLETFDRSVGETLATHTFPAGGPPRLLFSEIRHVGNGAMARGDRELSAFGHRDRDFVFHVVSVPQHHSVEELEAFQASAKAALGEALSSAVFSNFVDFAERRDRTTDATEPSHHAALAELQNRLDPQGVLRFGVDHRSGA